MAQRQPMEMVLMALAGCSGVDIALIVKKKRLDVRDFQILVEGERADEHPRVFTKVNMTFVFEGADLTSSPWKMQCASPWKSTVLWRAW